jgi:hypothetical protein
MRKRRDSGIDRVLIVLADTRANRAALKAAMGLLVAEFSFDQREIKAALADGRIPPRDGVLLLPIVRQREAGRIR